jgi:predicted CXXCH cytochrome family protein
MKKVLVALALAAFATTASATIAGGWHDMTTTGRPGYTGTKGTCQYCHAPHLWVTSNISVGSEAPLWNRNNVTATYTAYSAGTPQPGPRSLTCLSCHDGAAGNNVGAVNNGPSENLTVGGLTIQARANVGTNLQNDHPVGVLLPGAGAYQVPTVNILIAGKVECASCHEPHSDASFFLRASAATICSDCHTK